MHQEGQCRSVEEEKSRWKGSVGDDDAVRARDEGCYSDQIPFVTTCSLSTVSDIGLGSLEAIPFILAFRYQKRLKKLDPRDRLTLGQDLWFDVCVLLDCQSGR